MSLIQVGLLDKTGHLDPELLQTVAAALNVQVTRDISQFWNVQATVIPLHEKRVPSGVWPVFLVKSLPPGEGGFHLDKHNQPFAEVIATPANDGWTVAASHEVIEMLVDPTGNRLQSSISIEVVGQKIQDGDGQFEYLVEACDPCEADDYSYVIQGVVVSDFLTPHFYDPVVTSGTRYSFTGALTAPRQVLPGGYISWINPDTDEWQQLQYIDPHQPPQIVDLGPATGKSLREWVHTKNRNVGLKMTRYLSEKGLKPGLPRGSNNTVSGWTESLKEGSLFTNTDEALQTSEAQLGALEQQSRERGRSRVLRLAGEWRRPAPCAWLGSTPEIPALPDVIAAESIHRNGRLIHATN